MMKLHLLLIDPQNDFCLPTGALPVPGAMNDMTNVSNMIGRVGDKIYDIHVTLDTHHYLDIAHPSWWINSGSKSPDFFTIITASDVRNGVWRSKIPAYQKRSLEYVERLESNGRYPLCIWPPHCLIGTPGHNVVQPLADTLLEWEKRHGWIDYVTKGSNMFTEHYSAVKADVPDPEDPTTELNNGLIEILSSADMIAIAGEAQSHCVANTIRDIANEFGAEHIKKMIMLTDCMSNVTGFEDLGNKFFDDMRSAGVQFSTSKDLLK